MREMAPGLLLTTLLVWVGWRVLKENKGNRLVTIGIIAIVIFFSGTWMNLLSSGTVTKVWLLAGFFCALVASMIFFARIARPVATGRRTVAGVSDSGAAVRRKWTVVASLVALEVLLIYLTGHFGQGGQTGWFMLFGLLWFLNSLALVGAVIAQLVPRRMG